MSKILFVNSIQKRCGVHQYGRCIFDIISKYSTKYQYEEFFCESEEQFRNKLQEGFVGVVYNYHATTLPWITHLTHLNFKEYGQVGIVHEPFYLPPFPIQIDQDPTYEERPPHYRQFGRPIFPYENKYELPIVPTIGSFGFGFADKGFLNLVKEVRNSFDKAILRLHLARSFFGDNEGHLVRFITRQATEILKGSNIKLEISYEFLTIPELINWLAQNTINAFFYDYKEGRGLSGVTDYAMSARRPILLTRSYMFKHLWDCDTIFTDTSNFENSIQNSMNDLQKYYNTWTPQKLAEGYDRVMTIALEAL